MEWKRLPEGDSPLTQTRALITNAGSTMMWNHCTQIPQPSLCEAVVGLEHGDVKVSRSRPQSRVQYKPSDSITASVTSAWRHCYSTVSLLNVIVVNYILLEDGNKYWVLKRIMSVNATQLPLTDLFWLLRIWCFCLFFPFEQLQSLL